MAKEVFERSAKAEARSPSPRPSPPGEGEPRIGEELHRLIEERVRAVVRVALEAKMEQIARVTPRSVFNGDDALFLAFQAGFVAGAHVASPHDKNALDIFLRCRGVLDKLAPIAAPTGGNAS